MIRNESLFIGDFMRQLIRRWLIASLLPYAMYLVAFVFESRVPGRDTPILRDQSLAFLPGDFGLALFVATPEPESARPSRMRRAAGLLLGLMAFIVVRRITYSPSDYSPRAWRSPSKIYHDVVICGVFGYLVVVRCLPYYIGTPVGHDKLRKLLGVAGLALWVGGAVWDELHDVVPNDRQHPNDWKPVWA